MKTTKITLFKEFKVGLPNYSNMTARMGLEAELDEDDLAPDGTPAKHALDRLWDVANAEISMESGDIDPSWIKVNEFKNFFRVRIPKEDKNE